jgi:hypothetical protein
MLHAPSAFHKRKPERWTVRRCCRALFTRTAHRAAGRSLQAETPHDDPSGALSALRRPALRPRADEAQSKATVRSGCHRMRTSDRPPPTGAILLGLAGCSQFPLELRGLAPREDTVRTGMPWGRVRPKIASQPRGEWPRRGRRLLRQQRSLGARTFPREPGEQRCRPCDRGPARPARTRGRRGLALAHAGQRQRPGQRRSPSRPAGCGSCHGQVPSPPSAGFGVILLLP